MLCAAAHAGELQQVQQLHRRSCRLLGQRGAAVGTAFAPMQFGGTGGCWCTPQQLLGALAAGAGMGCVHCAAVCMCRSPQLRIAAQGAAGGCRLLAASPAATAARGATCNICALRTPQERLCARVFGVLGCENAVMSKRVCAAGGLSQSMAPSGAHAGVGCTLSTPCCICAPWLPPVARSAHLPAEASSVSALARVACLLEGILTSLGGSWRRLVSWIRAEEGESADCGGYVRRRRRRVPRVCNRLLEHGFFRSRVKVLEGLCI